MDKTLYNPTLAGGSFFLQGSRTGILLIHGFTATTAEVRLLAQKLYNDGFTVSAPLLPGHGTNLDDLNQIHWEVWISSVEESYRDLAAGCDRVIVGGESMGGLLSLYLAYRYPEISMVLAYSPAIKVHSLWKSQFVYPFVRYQAKKNLDDGLAWQGYRYNPTRAGKQLYRMQQYMNSRYSQVRQPVAIFLGGLDETIDLQKARQIYDLLPSTAKAFYFFEQSSHCMILDRDLDQIHDQSLKFIRQNLQSKNVPKNYLPMNGL